MKRIIFCDIPMKKDLDAMVYAGTGNINSGYSKPVIFPINAIIAETLKKNDDIKVVLLRTIDKAGNSGKNCGLFMQELDTINEDIAAKISYGPKPLPMILICVLSFAEKFLNCDVKSVVYGKVSFGQDNKACSPELFDVTSLYYLNNLTNSMVAGDGKEARKNLDEFFSL